MFAAERRRAILAALREHGRIEVKAIAEQLNVTPETVRKDLAELEHKGFLRRTHGGAVRIERLSYSTPVTAREGLLDEEKEAIARAALAEIEDDSTIAIDAGTTTIKLAEAISQDRRLTVVTYSVLVAAELAGHPHVHVHMLGGEVQANSRAAVGEWALSQIEQVTLDTVFLSVDGINRHHGLTTHNSAEASVKRALMKAARTRIVMADRTKLRREEFARVSSLDDVDMIITDSGADEDYLAQLQACGPKVVAAKL